MKYRQVGKWGVRISGLGIGTHMNIGYTLDEAASREMLRTAYEAGVNFIDTADSYSDSAAETMLGKILPDFPRPDFFLLTKAYGQMGKDPNERGLSAKHLRDACDASLKRLRTDYIDCYLCHHPDPNVPLEETVRAMADLHRAGKILYWGVSNWPATLIVKTNAIAREVGAPPIAVNEPRYNLIWRWPELDIFPVTAEEGIGNVTFSPLGHGMLAGIYKPGEEAPVGSRAADAANNEVTKKLYYNEERKRQAQELVRLAEGLGVTAAELAIAWCLHNPVVSSVIVGAWSVAELESDLRAAALEIPDDVVQQINALYPAPAGAPQI